MTIKGENMDVTFNNIEATLMAKGHQIQPYPHLNLIGIRHSNPEPDTFRDKMVVFQLNKDESSEIETAIKVYSITTVPGTHWLEHPLNQHGCAILVPGQYINTWKLGEHFYGAKKPYECLRQRTSKDVSVYRDDLKDGKLQFNEASIQSGQFEIEIHHGTPGKAVEFWSAGCQVFESYTDYAEFIKICETVKDQVNNQYTYTLLDEADMMGLKS